MVSGPSGVLTGAHTVISGLGAEVAAELVAVSFGPEINSGPEIEMYPPVLAGGQNGPRRFGSGRADVGPRAVGWRGIGRGGWSGADPRQLIGSWPAAGGR